MPQTSHAPLAAVVGLDWAEAQPEGGLQTAGSANREDFQLDPPPEAIAAGGPTRRTQCTGHPVALGLARPPGPLGSA
jgi:hypothetical protein